MFNKGNLWAEVKKVLPALILGGFCLFSLLAFYNNYEVSGDTTTYIPLFTAHYAGFVAAALCLLTFFLKRFLYRYVLGLTLLLGLLNVILFNIYESSAFVGVGSLSFTFNPTVLLLIVLTYALNYKSVHSFIYSYRPATWNE